MLPNSQLNALSILASIQQFLRAIPTNPVKWIYDIEFVSL
jgi:hypothetical protein